MLRCNPLFVIILFIIVVVISLPTEATYHYGIGSSYYYSGPKIPLFPATYCPPIIAPTIPTTTNYYQLIPTVYRPYVPVVYTSPLPIWYSSWPHSSYFWKIRSQNGTNTTDYIYKSKWYSPFWKYQGSIQHFPLSNETKNADDDSSSSSSSSSAVEKESEPIMMMKENETEQLERESEPMNENKMEMKNEKLKKKKSQKKRKTTKKQKNVML
ncbi:hypothetical protein HUG17_10513 [Dermatophagoides farinae]|uniref:Uncharacterized protein n=1 Tax=Dermatophagoides farinae TaxID=6954 RepID=A0A9D4NQW0_DERFA|nr:hypothetical protein HUG17_10513 [Dermatophagoides farinae]